MPLIIGNWKMNGARAALAEAKTIAQGAPSESQLVICPPTTLLMAMSELLKDSPVQTGGQDCHPSTNGAHTGRIAAEMIADAGASYCIVGHSECRAELGDNDETLAAKTDAILRAGLVPVFCVGESLATREDGGAEDFVRNQLSIIKDKADKVIAAYEPIWAIGTGLTPSTDEIGTMHAVIRETLGTSTPLLYGGSVNPTNAQEILAVENVGGALVGGASLKASDFLAIAKAG